MSRYRAATRGRGPAAWPRRPRGLPCACSRPRTSTTGAVWSVLAIGRSCPTGAQPSEISARWLSGPPRGLSRKSCTWSPAHRAKGSAARPSRVCTSSVITSGSSAKPAHVCSALRAKLTSPNCSTSRLSAASSGGHQTRACGASVVSAALGCQPIAGAMCRRPSGAGGVVGDAELVGNRQQHRSASPRPHP